MADRPDISIGWPDDPTECETLLQAAFPDEDLRPLLRNLVRSDAILLTARHGNELTGLCILTLCRVSGDDRLCALLGPLAVAPQAQSRGSGSAMVRSALDHLRQMGCRAVFVLGDPAYYNRFGFSVEKHVAPAYDLPPDYARGWQSLNLDGSKGSRFARIELPPAWLNRDLWLP